MYHSSSLLLFSLSNSKVRQTFIDLKLFQTPPPPLLFKTRTKQEIEADYQRRKIVKKFRKRIQKFENSEMDAEMDLKKGEKCLRTKMFLLKV